MPHIDQQELEALRLAAERYRKVRTGKAFWVHIPAGPDNKPGKVNYYHGTKPEANYGACLDEALDQLGE